MDHWFPFNVANDLADLELIREMHVAHIGRVMSGRPPKPLPLVKGAFKGVPLFCQQSGTEGESDSKCRTAPLRDLCNQNNMSPSAVLSVSDDLSSADSLAHPSGWQNGHIAVGQMPSRHGNKHGSGWPALRSHCAVQ